MSNKITGEERARFAAIRTAVTVGRVASITNADAEFLIYVALKMNLLLAEQTFVEGGVVVTAAEVGPTEL